MPSSDCLHSLTVDFEFAPTLVRPAFEFRPNELVHIARRAGLDGVPLLFLCTPTLLHMVSTSKNHVVAFRPVLARVHARARGADGWRALPVRIASGADSARELLKQAIPSTRFGPDVRQFVAALRAAAALSRSAGAFSAELEALLRMTEQTASRIWDETRLGRISPDDADRELETLVAERIVEEELVAWQSSYPALRSSRRPVPAAEIGPFESEERRSFIRLRPGSVLSKLGAGSSKHPFGVSEQRPSSTPLLGMMTERRRCGA